MAHQTQSNDVDSHLIDFFGTECPHCHDMEPLVKQLEEELGIQVKRMEVWHDAENAEIFQKYDKGRCGGVPYFYNTKTDKFICGATSYEKLKEWAEGK